MAVPEDFFRRLLVPLTPNYMLTEEGKRLKEELTGVPVPTDQPPVYFEPLSSKKDKP